eukprot:1338941-Rhodomonas_salina.1
MSARGAPRHHRASCTSICSVPLPVRAPSTAAAGAPGSDSPTPGREPVTPWWFLRTRPRSPQPAPWCCQLLAASSWTRQNR